MVVSFAKVYLVKLSTNKVSDSRKKYRQKDTLFENNTIQDQCNFEKVDTIRTHQAETNCQFIVSNEKGLNFAKERNYSLLGHHALFFCLSHFFVFLLAFKY